MNHFFSVSLSLKITGVLTLILGLLTGFKDSSYLPSLLLENTPYIITLLILFVAVCIVNSGVFIHGFKIKNGVNSDFAGKPCQNNVIFAHTVLLLFDSNLLIDDGTSYPFAGGVCALLKRAWQICVYYQDKN